MKAKVLVLAAALGLAATSTSTAQVYSVNAVGYVNINVPPNGYAILGVPLNGTNNSLNTTLPLSAPFSGVNVFRFNAAIQAFSDAITWVEGLGWYSPSDPDPAINPGEGFFLQNVANQPLPITWVGEVSIGTLNNPIPGGNRYSMLSSKVPKRGTPDELGIPPQDGDTIFIFDPGCQCYKDAYTYLGGLGWFYPPDGSVTGPIIEVGTGFFFLRSGVPSIWTQTFSVN